MGFIKKTFTRNFDEITSIDFSIFDQFLELYKIYLEKKKIYDSYVKEAESFLPNVERKDIVRQINLKILEKKTQKFGMILSHNSVEKKEVNDEISFLQRLGKNVEKYQKVLASVGLSDDDVFSKFVEKKSLDEIEKDVRESNKGFGEYYIIQKINDTYNFQDKVSCKKIIDLYMELCSVKKYINIINEYNSKIKKSNIFSILFVKIEFNKKLRNELMIESNKNFSDILIYSKNIFVSVVSEIKKYTMFFDAVSKFNSNYSNVIGSICSFDEDVIEYEPKNYVIMNNDLNVDKQDMVKLYDLYKSYGVDESFFTDYKEIFDLNYNEALVKLKFCEDFYNSNYSCSASGSFFQIEILLMTNMDFHAKFNVNISDLFKYYNCCEKNELNMIDSKNYKKVV